MTRMLSVHIKLSKNIPTIENRPCLEGLSIEDWLFITESYPIPISPEYTALDIPSFIARPMPAPANPLTAFYPKKADLNTSLTKSERISKLLKTMYRHINVYNTIKIGIKKVHILAILLIPPLAAYKTIVSKKKNNKYFINVNVS